MAVTSQQMFLLVNVAEASKYSVVLTVSSGNSPNHQRIQLLAGGPKTDLIWLSRVRSELKRFTDQVLTNIVLINKSLCLRHPYLLEFLHLLASSEYSYSYIGWMPREQGLVSVKFLLFCFAKSGFDL